MTTTRSNYIYELVGKVNEKKKRTSRSEKYKGEAFYILLITCENKPQVQQIFAYQNKIEKEGIWKDVLESNYIDKRYLFYCKNYMGNYYLIDWKELKNHGNN